MTQPKIRTVKPDGENGPRYYLMGDDPTPIPGVTSVLKMKSSEGLIHWAANESSEFAVRATRDPAWRRTVEAARVGDNPFAVAEYDWRMLCMYHPDEAYKLAKSARFRRNRIAVNKGNDAHDTIERVAFMSLEQLRSAYVDAIVSDGNPWALRAWGEFVKRFNVRVIESEVTIYSTRGYMGTCDLIVEMDTPWLDTPEYGNLKRGTVIIDTKTGKGVYPEVALQLAAYRYGDFIIETGDDGEVMQRTLPRIDGAAVFWPNEQDWSLIPAAVERAEWLTFIALLDVFRWDKGAGKKALGKAVVGRKTRKAAAPINWDEEAGA